MSLPTRKELEKVIEGQIEGGDEVGVKPGGIAYLIAGRLLQEGWLEVAPEKVKPVRGDLMTMQTALVHGMVIRHEPSNTVKQYDHIRMEWFECGRADGISASTVTAFSDCRIIEVPGEVEDKPAPKYTAERQSDGCVGFTSSRGCFTLLGLEQAEDMLAKWQAVVAFLDREASGVEDK